MKIGAISDLHIDRPSDYNKSEYAESLAQIVQSKQLDILLIAGDISNNYKESYQFVLDMKQLTGIAVYFIPGNHDYWSVDDKTTKEIHDYFINQPECLIGHPLVLNDEWAIVGNSGWYDYSYASEQYSIDQLKRGRFKGATWQDKVHIDWGVSDIEMSRDTAKQAEQDLKQVQDKNIILMTHVVTEPSFKVPMPHRIFNYFNAFIGTSDFAPLYQKYPIRYSIMGHVHYRGTITKDNTDYMCVSLGYFREWRTKDIKREMTHALNVIEI